ncbi:MAG TPA: hypothetical protein VHE30_25360 [Polyangiaceae bacterium]|nr:hypothetical protein [Polyangiaceae bacterium]
MNTSPIKAVKDRFGDKAKLVAAVKGLATPDLWLDRLNEDRGFESISNSKLLRLHDALSRVKKEFGSRDKLIESILGLEKSAKDTGLKGRLEKFPTPRLLDLQGSAARRAKAEEKAAKSAKKAKKTPAKTKPARTKVAKAKRAAKAPAPKNPKKK